MPKVRWFSMTASLITEIEEEFILIILIPSH